MASYDFFADLLYLFDSRLFNNVVISLYQKQVTPGLSQGVRASQREFQPLTGRPGLSQGGRFFSQGSRASHREAGPLTGKLGLSQGGRASYREAGPLIRRPGLSPRG